MTTPFYWLLFFIFREFKKLNFNYYLISKVNRDIFLYIQSCLTREEEEGKVLRKKYNFIQRNIILYKNKAFKYMLVEYYQGYNKIRSGLNKSFYYL